MKRTAISRCWSANTVLGMGHGLRSKKKCLVSVLVLTVGSALELLTSHNNANHRTFPTQTFAIIGQTAKQCHQRWVNQLDPQISKAPWSKEEYRIILQSQRDGPVNKFANIAKCLPGRTGNAVKNLWKNSLKRKVENYVYNKDIDGEHKLKDDEGRYLIDDIEGCLSSL